MKSWGWVVVVLALSANATGSFDKRLINKDLKSQIDGETTRRFPKWENARLATDSHGFYQSALDDGHPGYYHGGYWIPIFGEYEAFPELTANGKFVFYNTSYSYGYVSGQGVLNFLSVTWKPASYELFGQPVFFELTLADLDRQTLGAGLTLNDKEMSGVMFALTRGPLRIRHVWDGTGGYDVGGDLHYWSGDIYQDLVGVYGYDLGEKAKPIEKHSAFYGVYSKHKFANDLTPLLELSHRNKVWAYMIGAEFESRPWVWLDVKSKFQYRRYDREYGTGIIQNIEHDYLTIEQEDKDFTDSMNIFVHGDEVSVFSGRMIITGKPSETVWLRTDNEYMLAKYADYGSYRPYFFRHSFFFFPHHNRAASIEIYVSNKVVNAIDDPRFNDYQNYKSSFKDVLHYAVAGRFSF